MEYSEENIRATMVHPCQSCCQEIMIKQMKEKWAWVPDFMIRPDNQLRYEPVQLVEETVGTKGKGNAGSSCQGE